MAKCKDCKGSGRYVGFTVAEDCSACAGRGEIPDWVEAEVSARQRAPDGRLCEEVPWADLQVGDQVLVGYTEVWAVSGINRSVKGYYLSKGGLNLWVPGRKKPTALRVDPVHPGVKLQVNKEAAATLRSSELAAGRRPIKVLQQIGRAHPRPEEAIKEVPGWIQDWVNQYLMGFPAITEINLGDARHGD